MLTKLTFCINLPIYAVLLRSENIVTLVYSSPSFARPTLYNLAVAESIKLRRRSGAQILQVPLHSLVT